MLISKEYLTEQSQATMKHPRSFYVKSSGNQQLRLGSTPPMNVRYHQINPADLIKKMPGPLLCQRYTQIILFTLFFNK